MTILIGVVCDFCGNSDMEDAISDFGVTVDSFPRKGWISVSTWEDGGTTATCGPEMHVCSVECLNKLSVEWQKVINQEKPNQDSYPHSHPHM